MKTNEVKKNVAVKVVDDINNPALTSGKRNWINMKRKKDKQFKRYTFNDEFKIIACNIGNVRLDFEYTESNNDVARIIVNEKRIIDVKGSKSISLLENGKVIKATVNKERVDAIIKEINRLNKYEIIRQFIFEYNGVNASKEKHIEQFFSYNIDNFVY